MWLSCPTVLPRLYLVERIRLSDVLSYWESERLGVVVIFSIRAKNTSQIFTTGRISPGGLEQTGKMKRPRSRQTMLKGPFLILEQKSMNSFYFIFFILKAYSFQVEPRDVEII